MKKLLFLIITIIACSNSNQEFTNPTILTHTINLEKQNLAFFYQDKNGNNFGNFKILKSTLNENNQELIFAMNGGMYNQDLSPQGLYVENEKTLSKIDTATSGYGNFYLQPNGIFYLTKENKPVICTTVNFKNDNNVKYATQSGPMLLIDGEIHPKFTDGSKNVHIRNGVGILPNGELLFAMSKEEINFFDFATFFKKQGCKNALYLDGFVSKTYLPSKNWEQTDGSFGVIIAETKSMN